MSNGEIVTWNGKMVYLGRVGQLALPELLVLHEVVLLVDADVIPDRHTTCVLPGFRQSASALSRNPGEALDHAFALERAVLKGPWQVASSRLSAHSFTIMS